VAQIKGFGAAACNNNAPGHSAAAFDLRPSRAQVTSSTSHPPPWPRATAAGARPKRKSQGRARCGDRPPRLPRRPGPGWRPRTMSSGRVPPEANPIHRLGLQKHRSRPGPLQQVCEGRPPPRGGPIKGGGRPSKRWACHQRTACHRGKASPRRKAVPGKVLCRRRTAGHQRQACHQTTRLRPKLGPIPAAVCPTDGGRHPGPLAGKAIKPWGCPQTRACQQKEGLP